MALTTFFSSLVILALIDSTSFGTLLIPVWLIMTSRRVRADRFFIYLFTVVGLYFLFGLIIMFGADLFLSRYGSLLESKQLLIAQLILGILLLIISQLMDSKKARLRASERAAQGGGRILNWRKRIMGDKDTNKNTLITLIGLALTAVMLEIATMLPYLAAIGLIAVESPTWSISILLLLGYCIVMVLPALLLLVGRLVAHRTLEPILVRLDKWLTKSAQSTTAWVIGIVGFLLSANAIYDLGCVG